MMFVTFNSNTTGVACGTGTADLFGAPEFHQFVTGFGLLYVMFCRSILVLLSFFFLPLHCLSFDWRLLYYLFHIFKLTVLVFYAFLLFILFIFIQVWYWCGSLANVSWERGLQLIISKISVQQYHKPNKNETT
jgi:hypothetical protein